MRLNLSQKKVGRVRPVVKGELMQPETQTFAEILNIFTYSPLNSPGLAFIARVLQTSRGWVSVVAMAP